jgi:hypothetical protein
LNRRTSSSRTAGRPRYTAYKRDLKDRECSAGTFPNKKDADRAWQRAEAKVAEGRLGDPGRGRQTFQAYVEQVWLPGDQIARRSSSAASTTHCRVNTMRRVIVKTCVWGCRPALRGGRIEGCFITPSP